jgi:hypothetical protein
VIASRISRATSSLARERSFKVSVKKWIRLELARRDSAAAERAFSRRLLGEEPSWPRMETPAYGVR